MQPSKKMLNSKDRFALFHILKMHAFLKVTSFCNFVWKKSHCIFCLMQKVVEGHIYIYIYIYITTFCISMSFFSIIIIVICLSHLKMRHGCN